MKNRLLMYWISLAVLLLIWWFLIFPMHHSTTAPFIAALIAFMPSLFILLLGKLFPQTKRPKDDMDVRSDIVISVLLFALLITVIYTV